VIERGSSVSSSLSFSISSSRVSSTWTWALLSEPAWCTRSCRCTAI